MKSTLFLVFVFLLSAEDAGAQDQHVVDSLTELLQSKTGADRFRPLYELTFEYVDRDNSRALEIIAQAEQAALLSGDSLSIVKSKRVKGQMLSRLERLPESIKSCEEALSIAARNGFARERAMILNSLATSYRYSGQDDTGLAYFFQTLELAEAQQDSSLLANALNNIGTFYYRFDACDKALQYFLSSLAIAKAIDEVPVIFLINISLCYAQLGKFDSARLFLAAGLKECGKGGCTARNFRQISFTEGLISFLGKEYPQAEKRLLQSLLIAEEQGEVRTQLEAIDIISRIYLRQGHIDKAESLLLEGERMIDAGYPFSNEILRIYSLLLQLHRLQGNFERIAYYSEKYITLKDSIKNDALTTNLMRTEAEFLQRKNEARIEAQREVILLNEEVIRNQRWLNLAIAVLALTILTFAAFLFRNYRVKRNLNVLLAQKVKERTVELEVAQDELRKIIRQKDLRFSRLSRMMFEACNTVEGLCFAGARETSEVIAHSYFSRIHNTTRVLANSH